MARIPSDLLRRILARLPVRDLARFRSVSKFFRSVIDGPDFTKLSIFMARITSDGIREILLRLPVKDLLRFRCVLKFFRSVIDSPDFVKMHLSHSRKTNTNLYGMLDSVQFKHPEVNFLDLSGECKAVAGIHHDYRLVATRGSVVSVNRPAGLQRVHEVLGSCDGLVALRNEKAKRDLTIWNPMTGKFKKIASDIPLPSNKLICYGFGYDPKTDDYKLVGIAYSSGSVVYSLKTNSWRESCQEWSFCCKCPNDNRSSFWNTERCYTSPQLKKQAAVLANNNLHWGCIRDEEAGVEGIVAFDLVKEEFHCVPIPERVKKDHFGMKLGALDGFLTFSSNDIDGAYVWIMKDYGVKESWTKFLYFDWFNDAGRWLRDLVTVTPLAYSRKRDKILLNHRGDIYDLHWCDVSSEYIESCSYGIDSWDSGGVKTFIGSLVALNESTNEVDLKRKLSSTNMATKRGKTGGEDGNV